jgi:tRNA-dependent cyclodipeptide synthase
VANSDPALRLIFDWTRTNVGRFDVFIGDYLNRHNHQAFDGLSEAMAIQRTRAEGKRFMERIARLMEESDPNGGKVLSSSSFYHVSGFGECLAYFKGQYASHARFKSFIDEAVSTFLARKRNVIVDDAILEHCVDYQLEELVLFEQMSEEGYRTLVYPGAHLPVMKGFVVGTLPGVAPQLEKYTLVELRAHKAVR